METLPGWLAIGTIVAPQGLQGEVRVYPDSDFPERFLEPGDRWILRSGESEPQKFTLAQGRYLESKGLYVVRFAEVCDRTQAEQLRQASLLVPESDRPVLAEGEFHLLDLINVKVFHGQTHEQVGTIIGVVAAGNHLLEVALTASPETTVLIPLVREIVPLVDLSNQRVEILPPTGLLPH